jgi:putative membrane protein
MPLASVCFTDVQKNVIEQAVIAAEAGTSCEIVPVVASASGRYDRPEDMVGLWFALLTAVAVWLLLPRRPFEPGDWDVMPLYVEVLILAVSIVAAFLVGAFTASRVDWLRRLCTPRRQMQEEVARRAREVFFDKRVHHTAGG